MSRMLRAAIGACLAAFVLWAHPEPVRTPELDRLAGNGHAIRELLERFGHWFTPLERDALRESSQQLIAIGLNRDAADSRARDELAISIGETALARAERALDGSGHVERLWSGARPFSFRLVRRWPSGRGALLLRIGQPGSPDGNVSEFVTTRLDLADSPEPVLRIGPSRTVYAIVFVENGAARTPVSIAVLAGGRHAGTIALSATVPPPGGLRIEVYDETGKPTAGVAGLYAADKQLLVPAQAISFGGSRRPQRSRRYQEPRYWPGGPQQREVFFFDSRFSLDAPEGEYSLIVGKGMEYTPVVRRVRVKAGAQTRYRVDLRRWIHMPELGWTSGDGHVHYERRDREANRMLLTWVQAEDVHVANVMHMGDVRGTYFEQYAFGPKGRAIEGAYSLVPGQENPRTPELGHVLAMNISAPVHKPDQYYLYDLVLDEVRRQGGLTGYAHLQQPPRVAFHVRRDMSLNVPKGIVDFLEVAEFGDIDDRLYHEFLNLGFKLTASAGSDVPWGDTIGASRVYAYTGGSTHPDDWFRAVKLGRTFVTTGPMLSLRVNGQLPGAEIQARAGDRLSVQVEAQGDLVAPRYAEVVSQGGVIGSAVELAPGQRKVELQMRLPVSHSMWIAARCSGAITSPVYVRVEGQPFWNRTMVPELVDLRLRQLGEMEAFAKRALEPEFSGEYKDPEMLRRQVSALLERVEAARRIYLDMKRRAQE